MFAQERRARAPAVSVGDAGEKKPVGEPAFVNEPRVFHVLARPIRLGGAPVVLRNGRRCSRITCTILHVSKRKNLRAFFGRRRLARQHAGRRRLSLLGGVVCAGDAAGDGLLLRTLRRRWLSRALAHAGHVLVLRALGRERARDEAQADDAQRRAHVPPEGGDEIALAAPSGARHESGRPPATSSRGERSPRGCRRDGHEPHARSEAAARIRRARADVDDPRAGGDPRAEIDRSRSRPPMATIRASRRNTGGFVNRARAVAARRRARPRRGRSSPMPSREHPSCSGRSEAQAGRARRCGSRRRG